RRTTTTKQHQPNRTRRNRRMKTISDLILELEQVRYEQGDIPVLVDGYEDDYDAPGSMFVLMVADMGKDEKAHSWWNGRYQSAEFVDQELPIFNALVIPR